MTALVFLCVVLLICAALGWIEANDTAAKLGESEKARNELARSLESERAAYGMLDKDVDRLEDELEKADVENVQLRIALENCQAINASLTWRMNGIHEMSESGSQKETP